VSDRLAELSRQRALVQEHLAWLDREIAALKGAAGASELRQSAPLAAAPQAAQAGGAAVPPSPIASVTVIPAAPAADPADAEAMIQRYGYDPTSGTADVKRGCWIAFGAALVLLGLAVTVAWFLLRRP